jgi:hypothetical protein
MNREDTFSSTIVLHFTTNFNMVVVYSSSSTNSAVWQAHIRKKWGFVAVTSPCMYSYVPEYRNTRVLLCRRSASFSPAVQVTLFQRSLGVPPSSYCSLGPSRNALETQGNEEETMAELKPELQVVFHLMKILTHSGALVFEVFVENMGCSHTLLLLSVPTLNNCMDSVLVF